MQLSERLENAANGLADIWDADLLYINSEIDRKLLERVIRETEKRKDPGNVLYIFLTTTGGSAEFAYKVMRYLKSKYWHGVVVFALGPCKGAGTLMCAGATEIWVGDSSEFSPLSCKTAAVANASSNQLTEDTLRAYAERLNRDFRTLRKEHDFDALAQLISGYPSPDFIIDGEEISTLFNRVYRVNEQYGDEKDHDVHKVVRFAQQSAARPNKAALGLDPEIFYLNGEYNWEKSN
ncbi:hypothetical protein [Mesorhizobium sp. M2C.T.Ca.TU.002.02.1.1]|uniref:hypothetical protein n=1 Tax=Mesorhizobium sp. M2C.T.Ca.TU.002.02.1.1 TaxID=2496788 RepID=UPI000FCBF1BF|nr:hypothetical protein [Mesorhizobium sp. M2C.T.Ca.TU.002.02.1.1]RUU54086.1 hypothetical protein EOD07_22390 [Mesorhizobium sp. M2C.T.Ca.TU.002.02.1.1]RUU71605.1 hypothetical protein EOD04_02085 [Mesorhizobium sp. M2C.T.Ca.TU.009.01.2.1]